MQNTRQFPILSVIIPVYNRKKYVVDAIYSAINQSIKEPLEVIVVDDGSTDGTDEEVVKIQRDKKNVLLVRQENRGPSAARNTGLRIAHGEFIQFLDSDDIIDERKLELQLHALRIHTAADFATCCWCRFDDNTGQIKNTFGCGKSEWQILPDFLHFDFWPNGTPLYRREICEKTGPWIEGMNAFEDWEWHIRMALCGGKGVHIPQTLMFVRDHEDPRLSRQKRVIRSHEINSFNKYLEVIFEHFKNHLESLRRYAIDLSELFFRAAFWNFRVEFMEQGYYWGAKAIEFCPMQSRKMIYNLTLKIVEHLGISRCIRIWDKLSSLSLAVFLRRLIWGK